MKTSDYTAVVLLAGYGSRISSVTEDPKCLLPVGDKIILHRHLRAFKQLGIRKVVLVVGYRKEKVIEAARVVGTGLDIKIISNDEYETKGNGYSFFMGIEAASGPVVVFDGDLVYAPRVLKAFLEGEQSSGVIVGEASLDDIECAKALVDESNMVRKTVEKRAVTEEELAEYRFVGEAFGMLRFSEEHRLGLLGLSHQFFADESNLLLNWEHLMSVFFLDHDVECQFEVSTDWVEIDTAEDYETAKSKAANLD
ncbi:MAG: NTP transferase domain-containing protein [Limisphaerales bacterium]